MARPARLALVLGLLAALSLSVGSGQAASDGEALYRIGARPGAPVPIARTTGDRSVPASALPCAGCHGADGLGRPEGAVRPPPITWSALTRTEGGRRGFTLRPPYDGPGILRAMTLGLDPAGTALDPVMPRYGLSAEDGAALLVWLMALDDPPAPGITEQAIQIGLLVPGGPALPQGVAFAEAFVDAASRALGETGIHGRSLRPVAAAVANEAEALDAVMRLRGEGVFAIVSALPLDLARAAFEPAGGERVPVIALRAPAVETALPVYALLPGAIEEALGLVQAAGGAGAVEVLHGSSPLGQGLADTIAARLALREGPELRVRARGTSPTAAAVLLLGTPDEVRTLAGGLAGSGQTMLLPGSIGGAVLETLLGLGLPLHLAFAGFPGGASEARLAGALAQVTIEALRRAGSHPSWARLEAGLRAADPFGIEGAAGLGFRQPDRIAMREVYVVRFGTTGDRSDAAPVRFDGNRN